MRKFLSLVAALLPITVSITVFIYSTGILDFKSIENTRLGSILGLKNQQNNLEKSNGNGNLFPSFISKLADNFSLQKDNESFSRSNVLQASTSSQPRSQTNMGSELISLEELLPLAPTYPDLVTYENIKDASDGAKLLENYLNLRPGIENEVKSLNRFFETQRFHRIYTQRLEVNSKITLNTNKTPGDIKNSLYLLNSRLYLESLPLIQAGNASLVSNANKVAVFETDANGRLLLSGQDNIAIGGTLGVFGEFSAGSGSIINAFGVGTVFSAASGNITNNFGIGGSLGVNEAFSAGSGSIINAFGVGTVFSAASGSITNNFNVGGVFSGGSATLASALIRGNLVLSNPSGSTSLDFYSDGGFGNNVMLRSNFGNQTLAQINQDYTNALEIENYASGGVTNFNFPNDGEFNIWISTSPNNAGNINVLKQTSNTLSVFTDLNVSGALSAGNTNLSNLGVTDAFSAATGIFQSRFSYAADTVLRTNLYIKTNYSLPASLSRTNYVIGVYNESNNNIIIGSGARNLGYYYGARLEAYRNSSLDSGALNQLISADLPFGHSGNNPSTTIHTSEATGILLRPLAGKGTIDTIKGIDIKDLTKLGTVNNEWVIYSDWDAPSFLSDRLDLKNNTSTAYSNGVPSIGDTALRLYNQNTGASPTQVGIQFNLDGGGQNRISYIGSVIEGLNSARTSALVFATDNAGGRPERMRITSSGNVGIGTTDPLSNLQLGLHVSTGTADPVDISLGGTYSDVANSPNKLKLKLWDINQSDATTNGPWGLGISLQRFNFVIGDTTGQYVFWNKNGEIASISDKFFSLSARTALRVPSLAAGGTTLCQNGGVLSNCSSSLREYKENITDLTAGLNEILKLKPVEYDWKSDGVRDLGFIAEDVALVNPLLAEYGGENGELTGVKYSKLTSLLTKGIQEQQAQIQGLSNAIGNLNVSNLETLVASLNNTLDSLSMSTENGALVINSGLTVTGEALFNNATFTGDVAIGQMKFDSLNNDISINGMPCTNIDGTLNETLCETQTLFVMKNKAGNINFFDGKVVINPNGEMVLEKITAGEVAAAKISASEYEVMAGSDISGNTKILTGQNEVTILTSKVKENSKVFITPTGSLEGSSIYVDSKLGGVSFTVKLSSPISKDVEFDWFILNSE